MATTFLKNITLAISKECQCWGCKRTLRVGEIVVKLTSVENGVFIHTSWCDICQDYINQYGENGDLYAFGDIINNCDDEWTQRYEDAQRFANEEVCAMSNRTPKIQETRK